MDYLEGICMVEADTHVVWDQFSTEGPKGPAHWGPFVLVVVAQYRVARSRFVAGDHSSRAIFCFDIHA